MFLNLDGIMGRKFLGLLFPALGRPFYQFFWLPLYTIKLLTSQGINLIECGVWGFEVLGFILIMDTDSETKSED